MADIANYKIQFKSDFVLTIHGDAGWMTPFCIKFWTGVPSRAYFVGWDGKEYINCKVDETDASKLIVLFDDHQLPVGQLKMQMAYHTTIEDFPGSVFDEVTNASDVIVDIEGTEYHVMLDVNGETAPEIEFNLPAYEAEAERQRAEQQRQTNEQARNDAEALREQAESKRQQDTGTAIQKAKQATLEAENVNARLSSEGGAVILTITNRQGNQTSKEVGFRIAKTYPNVAAMNADLANVEEGRFVMIAGSTEDVDTGKLYVRGVSAFTFITDLSGAQGIKGDNGNGIASVTLNADYTLTIVFTDGTSTTTTSIRGEKGDTGATGAQGAKGDKGDKGDQGNPGVGVPTGGSTGQVLAKKSGSDYDTEWVEQSGGYEPPAGGIPKTDLDADVQTSLGKADTALQSFTESDPTVPSWAKQSSKPSYSYSEITDKPTLATVATSGSYNDLSNKPTIPDAVSGTNDGTNWTSIAIGNITKAIPSGGGSGSQVQADWNQSDGTAVDYIKNKPSIVSAQFSYDSQTEAIVISPAAAASYDSTNENLIII